MNLKRENSGSSEVAGSSFLEGSAPSSSPGVSGSQGLREGEQNPGSGMLGKGIQAALTEKSPHLRHFPY